MSNVVTAKAEKIYFAIRARLNAGADIDSAVKGAIRECGPLRTVRVSSAKARGTAKGYAYYGAARYMVTVAKSYDGLCNVALEAASSDRRSVRLAERDAEAIALAEDRAETQAIGVIWPETVAMIAGVEPRCWGC